MYMAKITRNPIVLFYHTLASQNLFSKGPVSSLAEFALQIYFGTRLMLYRTCVKPQILTQKQAISFELTRLFCTTIYTMKTMWILKGNPCELWYQTAMPKTFISFTFQALLISEHKLEQWG